MYVINGRNVCCIVEEEGVLLLQLLLLLHQLNWLVNQARLMQTHKHLQMYVRAYEYVRTYE